MRRDRDGFGHDRAVFLYPFLAYQLSHCGRLRIHCRHNYQLFPQYDPGFQEQWRSKKRISHFCAHWHWGASLDRSDSLDIGGQIEFLYNDSENGRDRFGSFLEFFHEKKICFSSGINCRAKNGQFMREPDQLFFI
jgi:hypothetical protein